MKPLIVFAASISLLAAGCGPERKGIGGASNSFLRDREQITFDFDGTGKTVSFASADSGRRPMFALAAALPVLAGFAIDLAKQEVEDEISRHTTTWDALAVSNRFLVVKYNKRADPKSGGTREYRYAGATLRRRAALVDDTKAEDIFEFKTTFDYDDASPIVAVRGQLTKFLGSRAKVGQSSNSCSIKVTLVVTGSWVDTADVFHSQQLGELVYTRTASLDGMSVDASPVDIGVIAVPSATTALTIKAVVAEADPRFPKKTAEASGKLIDSLKPVVIKAINDGLGLGDAAATKPSDDK